MKLCSFGVKLILKLLLTSLLLGLIVVFISWPQFMDVVDHTVYSDELAVLSVLTMSCQMCMWRK